MNIFVSHPSPVVSAANLDDKRVNKMITESAQMMSTCIHTLTEGDEDICSNLYRPSHQNHPCNIWIRESRANFMWLYEHAWAMASLKARFDGKVHKGAIMLDRVKDFAHYVPDGELTPFANCAANDNLNISFKHIEDPHEAYRMYLLARWENDKAPPKWEFDERGAPEWA